MRIPDVQARLLEIAKFLDESSEPHYGLEDRAQEIRELVQALYRRRPTSRAKPTAPNADRLPKEDIRRLAAQGWPQHDIAAKYGVADGRISEIISGRRT